MTTQTQPVTEAPVHGATEAAPAIELKHAARWYGNVVAVNDITFSLGPGVTGLLGPNGAGKTTLLHMLSCSAGARIEIRPCIGRSV